GAIDAILYYTDADADGHGDPASPTRACAHPAGTAYSPDDCDDTEPLAWTGAAERCDGVDNNCDGVTDLDAVDKVVQFKDLDGDTRGDPSTSALRCPGDPAWVSNSDDCDDGEVLAWTGATELCDGVDNDCDAITDDDAVDKTTYFIDSDLDRYGADDSSGDACPTSAGDAPAGYSVADGDCDDSDDAVHPAADEVWYDGVDQDCMEDSDYDQDGDGLDAWQYGGRDCDDADPAVGDDSCGGLSPETAMQSCWAIHEFDAALPSGLYWIDPDGDGDTTDAWQAHCDMSRDGGGWTLVMANNAAVRLTDVPTWVEAVGEINVLGGSFSSTLSGFDLWVGVAEWGEIGDASRWEVGTSPSSITYRAYYTLALDPAASYAITLSGESVPPGNTSPNFLPYHQGMRLSTDDADHDDYGGDCGSNYGGGPWWFKSCWTCSLWGADATSGGYWNGSYYSWAAIWLR
ncbi:MAG: hypothetical protein JXX28_14405, partial [Deltaproteobacteria bacterium]|nr:hypothetical protein [Deltaproteobacteria bacterium]